MSDMICASNIVGKLFRLKGPQNSDSYLHSALEGFAKLIRIPGMPTLDLLTDDETIKILMRIAREKT